MTIKIKIPDMSCDHCKKSIENAFRIVAGVDEVQINLQEKYAQVSGSIEVNQVIDAIRSAGYTAAEILSLKP